MLVPSAPVDTAAVLLEVGRSGTESQALAGLASDAFQRSYVLLFLLWSAYPHLKRKSATFPCKKPERSELKVVQTFCGI